MIKPEYEQLKQQIKAVLPIKAYPIRELLPLFKDYKNRVKLNTLLEITDVYNTGDISGIMCIVAADDENKIACALTHLIIPPDQPHCKEILDYQKKRIKRIRHLTR